MKLFAAIAVATLSLMASSEAQAQETKMREDLRMVAPALEKYAQDRLLGEVWKRPDLSSRDRSVITLAALIARSQTVELPFYLNLALDSGVKPKEISEIITHLAFYSGWSNAMAAVVVTKDVFAARKISADQLPAVSPPPLPLNEAAEADQRRAGRAAVRRGLSRCRAVHHRRSVPRPMASPGPCTARQEPSYGQRVDRHWPGRTADRAFEHWHEQRPEAG